MNEIIVINNQELPVKEYDGQRVVTFKDIDTIHKRPEGTARRNFNTNEKYFIEGEDFYNVKQSDIQMYEIRTLGFEVPNRGITLITESGYLMLVKSFTDDLAWDVQRDLVNKYFRAKAIKSAFSDLSPQLQLLIGMEIKQKEIEAKQQEQETAIANTNQRIDNMCEVISLDKNSWRKDTNRLITKISYAMFGSCGNIQDIYREIYKAVDERAGVALQIRLTNKLNRMAGEGISESKRKKVNPLDVIAEDKKLIEIFVTIVKELAIKYGVCL